MDLKDKFWWVPFGRVSDIDAKALHALLQEDPAPQILDVRTALEWNHSRIAGSISAPITGLHATLATLGLDKKRPVIAICLSAHRSIPAVRLLKENGFEQACQLKGGMRAWWKANLPVQGTAGE